MDVQIFFNLEDARIERDQAMEAIKREYEKAVERAAAVAAQKTRGVEQAWAEAERKERVTAGIREALVREHASLDPVELQLRLLLHEARLRPERRPRITSGQRATEQWYVDMIRAEQARRREPGCEAAL